MFNYHSAKNMWSDKSCFMTVETRRSLHLRLGLPFDRPLLRISNAIDLAGKKYSSSLVQKGKASVSYIHMFNMTVYSCFECSLSCYGLNRFFFPQGCTFDDSK